MARPGVSGTTLPTEAPPANNPLPTSLHSWYLLVPAWDHIPLLCVLYRDIVTELGS